jgi:hypothetical protein
MLGAGFSFMQDGGRAKWEVWPKRKRCGTREAAHVVDNCHEIPLRNTKRMPVRQARSEMRGRPPFGRGGGTGKSGSIRSHNASGNSTAAINRRRYCAHTEGVYAVIEPVLLQALN